MIVVSNEKLIRPNSNFMNYDNFVEKAYSDDGLDMDEGLAIDVNIIQQNVFEDLNSVGLEITYFTTSGSYPNFIMGVDVEDWSNFLPQENKSENVVNDINSNNTSSENNNGNTNNFNSDDLNDNDIDENISNLLNDSASDSDVYSDGSEAPKEARMIVFGSSKGGTGKTFTAIMSTYVYAKDHPDERIALVDFDIIDGQVGISIHKVRPTLARYYTEYQKGYRDFRSMSNFSVKGNNVFPQNVDFYLAPTSGSAISNNNFWYNVLENCMQNYDLVVFDTGIDYLNLVPISYAYKIADKINIVTTTSIKSVNSVIKQIGRLKGEIKSAGKDQDGEFTEWVFTKDDGLESRINVIITQMVQGDKMNKTIYNNLSSKANVIATFGVITDSVSSAEFFGEWNIFDSRKEILDAFRTIMS